MAFVLRIIELIGAICAAFYVLRAVYALAVRWKYRQLLLVLLLLIGLPSLAQATTRNVAACNGTNDHLKVQTQVDAAVDGDVIQLPSGTCTFGGRVDVVNKDLTVQGNGIGVTTITGSNIQYFFFQMQSASKGATILSDMTIAGHLQLRRERDCGNVLAWRQWGTDRAVSHPPPEVLARCYG